MYPSGWSMLSAVAACAVLMSTALSQRWFIKSILSEPLKIKIIPDPEEKKGWRPPGPFDEPDPELLPENDPSDEVATLKPPPPPPRYCRLEQIWDDDEEEWVEYTAPPPRKVPDDDKLLHWFKVYSRRRTYSKDEKPDPPLAVSPVQKLLRTTHGGETTFKNHPIVNIHQLFPLQDTFSEWLGRLELSELQKIDFEAKRQIAHSVGIKDAFDDNLDEPTLNKHFELLSRQLHELITCLSTEFEPILAEMETYLSHGHITFSLLGYMHKPGARLLMHDKVLGDKIAVKMKSCNYITHSNGTREFRIYGTGREWNGNGYTSVSHSRGVPGWGGTQSISELPWAKLNNEDEQELTERGRIYCQYSGIFHVYNKGPLGGSGRIMVDCTSYNAREDRWGGDRWGDEDAGNDADNSAIADLCEEELCLLPPCVSGFMLRTKKWVKVRVLCLEPVKFDSNAWEHLVLDPDTKLLVRSLVDVTCKDAGKSLVQDVITGKGGGLVSVLHGKPGTGKTLTAEAVAEHLERPIYIVGSEELPFEAASLETSLRRILDLAARWDAVLLIDEADVFLEQRSMHELQRNAVVSVALRLLEYHSGVLFLTTNRIKSFDEAFLSRFSIGIRYPDLDQSSRLKIWRSFLALAGVEVVDDEKNLATKANDGTPRVSVKDLDTLAEKSFNGRSIKNLVRTSQALALANNETLAIDHLRIVVKTSERFLRDFEEIEGVGA